MASQFTLGKKERVKSRKQIDLLFSKGQRIVVPPFRISFISGPTTGREQALMFGTGVSARYFKKAVDRNRIKRLTREAWRLQKKELQDFLLKQNRELDVFFIYTGKGLPSYQEILQQVAVAITKLMK